MLTTLVKREKEMFLYDNLKIFSGSSNPGLTKAVCKYLDIPLGGVKIERFPDGEKFIKLEDDVRGRDCFVTVSYTHLTLPTN